MKDLQTNDSAFQNRRLLFTLCRFIALRLSHRFMIALSSFTGLFLTVFGRTQFAPYGIALICLILPIFLSDSVKAQKETENNDTALSVLYKRYHYSPVMVTAYRITLLLCMLLLFVWHKVQTPALTLLGISLPLLYLALALALAPILSRLLFFFFHRRLMSGRL